MKLFHNLAIVAALLLAGCRGADDGNRVEANQAEAKVAPILTTPDAVDTSSYAKPLEARVTQLVLDLLVQEKRSLDLDLDPPDEPQVRRQAPAGLLDVVDRDVLEEARDRVEPDAAVRVDVGEPHATPCSERPSRRRPWQRRIHAVILR